LDLSLFSKESEDKTAQNPKYSLYGVVNHSGEVSGGHYTSTIKSKRDDKWYYISDEMIREKENFEN